MIYLADNRNQLRKQFQNAAIKCQQLEIKPKVKPLEPGRKYSVAGNQNTYILFFRRNRFGGKIIDCNCRAGIEGMVCYHAAAALAVHIAIVNSRKAAINH